MKATILIGILIMSIFDNVQCGLVTKPTDAVVQVNDSVIMECSSNDDSDICDMEWKHFKLKSRTGDAIYYNGQLTADFKSYISTVNTTVGNCNLKIRGTPAAAGKYQCVDMSRGDDASAELIIIDPGYRINGTMSECFVNYFGNCDPPMLQWLESNGGDWNPVDAVNKKSSQNFISITILTPTQPFMCKITASTSAGPFYEWHSPIEEGTAIETTQQITTTYESSSVKSKVNRSLMSEPKALSNANNESVSGNKIIYMAAIVGIVIGVFIVSCELT